MSEPYSKENCLFKAGSSFFILCRFKHENLDTIICNGVSMYFPSATYLLEVVQNALAALQPGGKFFLGDVRCNTVLPHFHSACQLHQVQYAYPVGSTSFFLFWERFNDGRSV